MGELRWNPFLGNYTMVAANRQKRPDMPQGWCPFCPGSGKVPDEYLVLAYNNDFPALSLNPDAVEVSTIPFFKPKENYGKCEVILYSSDHEAKLYELSAGHLLKLVQLWQDRYHELSQDDKIESIFIFENRGEEVGVTMPHPHGQIYAYPFVPLKQQLELNNAKQHFMEHGECLSCNWNREERAAGERMVYENNHFMAYIPYFTDYPFGVYISSIQHLNHIGEMDEAHKKSLANILKTITGAFDLLYDRPFPYMMCMQQMPIHAPEYAGCEPYSHFRIEFYPPLREANRIKYMASSETGAWAAANTMWVEDSAVLLRAAIQKFMQG